MVSLDIAGHGGRNKFPHLGWHLTSSNPSHTQQQQQRKSDAENLCGQRKHDQHQCWKKQWFDSALHIPTVQQICFT